MPRLKLLLAIVCALLLAACATLPGATPDPLPAWRDGPAKVRILAWVADVTEPASPNWHAPAERIAVFDHDGTLIVERPEIQFAFVYFRIRELAAQHPEWSSTPPFSTVLAGDDESLESLGFRERAPLLEAAQAGLTLTEFDAEVQRFLASARHPRFERPYRTLYYQPMRELVDLLQANDFRVFIVSAGGVHFMRGLSETAYGIPRERVIGSRVKTSLIELDGRLEVQRKAGFSLLNVGRFKALSIQDVVGRRPLLAVGNGDGDLEMLRFAEPGSLAIVLQHDDAEREYDYAEDASRLDAAAMARGWLKVSMRDDFATVFAGEAR